MISKIKRFLGFEKLHPDIQLFLDHSNLNIAKVITVLIMLLEAALFVNTFFYKIKPDQDPAKWLLYHRTLYAFIFLASAQLFAYSVYLSRKKARFSRITFNISLSAFFLALIIFAISITIKDYVQHEQILVFITVELFVTCMFMVKPYLAIIMILLPFSVFYYLMKISIGVSSATTINYPIIMLFFIIVNVVRYQQLLKVATSNYENKALAEQLRLSSLYDFLTKLKNRNALNMDFEETDENLNKNYLIMLTDIDNFKNCNDTNGHAYGDKLLKKFAETLQEQFGNAHCYRYGGDEYLIVVPEMNDNEFLQRIQACEKSINDEFRFSGGYSKGYITSSKELHTYINKADEFLYEAKNAGKNKVLGSF